MGAIASGLGSVAGGNIGGVLGGLSDNIVTPNNFAAAGTRIDSPVTIAQADTAYNQTQDALSQQNAFLQALQAQGGTANQSAIFNQLQGVANGSGPNPALAQLNQATGANVANQAALMAGQRGAGSNAGLIARQAALQGGNLQQQAVGQGATLMAQQQLNAMNAAGSIAGQQVQNQAGALNSYNAATQGQQQNLLNSINNANSARVNLVGGQNAVNSSTAAQNAKQTNDFSMGILQGGAQAAAMSDKNTKENVKDGSKDVHEFLDNISPKSYDYKEGKFGEGKHTGVMAQDLEKSEAGAAMIQETPEGKAVDYGKGFNTLAAALADIHERLKKMEGSGKDAVKMASGGMVDIQEAPQAAPQQPIYGVMDFLTGKPSSNHTADSANAMQQQVMAPQPAAPTEEKKGGSAMAGMMAGMMSEGGKVPGKAKVKGDSLKNDTVKTMLSPGEIVIPKSIIEGKNAPAEAAKFVAAILARKGK